MADQTEIERARTFLSDLRENLTSYHQPVPGEPGHCTCGRASGCTGDAEDLAAIATLDAALAERDALTARVAELEARPTLSDHGPDGTITINEYQPTPETHDQMRRALLEYYTRRPR